jgi:hypothetical protein
MISLKTAISWRDAVSRPKASVLEDESGQSVDITRRRIARLEPWDDEQPRRKQRLP